MPPSGGELLASGKRRSFVASQRVTWGQHVPQYPVVAAPTSAACDHRSIAGAHLNPVIIAIRLEREPDGFTR